MRLMCSCTIYGLMDKNVGLLNRGHAVWEIGGSNPGCGTMVGVFHPNQATGKVFSAEYTIYCKF